LYQFSQSRCGRIKDDFKSQSIKKAKQKLDVLKLSKEERKRYTRYLENLAIEYDVIESAREEGHNTRDEEVVLNRLKAGLSVDMLCQYTGLPRERIEAIGKNIML